MLTVMPTPDPLTYAEQWVQAWNAHGIDVVFTSPVAARVLPETGGVVRGKPALRDYWIRVIWARVPALGDG